MNTYDILKRMIPAILLCLAVISCNPTTPEQEVGSTEFETEPETEFEEEPIAGAEAPSTIDSEEYEVILDVDKNIELHKKGNFRVWIGLEEYAPKENGDMARDLTTMPSDLATYARITPHADEFEIEPDEPICVKLDPSGTAAMFSLIPQHKGTYKVSATVELFDNEECTGIPVTKTPDFLTVEVTVNNKVAAEDHAGELWSVFWEQFLKFWGAFVAVILGALIFVVRRFVKKKTGFSEGDGDNPPAGE